MPRPEPMRPPAQPPTTCGVVHTSSGSSTNAPPFSRMRLKWLSPSVRNTHFQFTKGRPPESLQCLENSNRASANDEKDDDIGNGARMLGAMLRLHLTTQHRSTRTLQELLSTEQTRHVMPLCRGQLPSLCLTVPSWSVCPESRRQLTCDADMTWPLHRCCSSCHPETEAAASDDTPACIHSQRSEGIAMSGTKQRCLNVHPIHFLPTFLAPISQQNAPHRAGQTRTLPRSTTIDEKPGNEPPQRSTRPHQYMHRHLACNATSLSTLLSHWAPVHS